MRYLRFWQTVVPALGLGALVATGPLAQSQPPPGVPPPAPGAAVADNDDADQQEGIEYLSRGPIHEAYATQGTPDPQAEPVVPKQPPEQIEELPSEQKPEAEEAIWVPGYWSWDEERLDFIWVSGFWRVPPPGRTWAPGYWTRVTNGWQWVAGFWMEEQQDGLTYLPSPPASLDAGPSVPAPDADSFYVPGNWVYQNQNFAWQAGSWMKYQPGWTWTQASWNWTPGGCVYQSGYWDYPLEDRGFLSAPCAFTQPLWNRPGWAFQPNYVVPWNYLSSCLFGRQGRGSYCFGDYFGANYQNGYRPWYNSGFGRYGANPLWNYYRWRNPGFAGNLRNIYQGRFGGQFPRPPRTLVQQNTLIQNIRNNKTVVNNFDTNTVINNVRGLAPLRQGNVNQRNLNLQRVPLPQRQQAQKLAQQFRQVAQQRSRAEANPVIKAPLVGGQRPQPRTVRLDNVPRPPAAKLAPNRQPPPRPKPPQVLARPQTSISRSPTVLNPSKGPALNPQRPIGNLPAQSPLNRVQPSLVQPRPTPARPPIISQPRPPVRSAAPSLNRPGTTLARPQPSLTRPQPLPKLAQPRPPLARPQPSIVGPRPGLVAPARPSVTRPQPSLSRPRPAFSAPARPQMNAPRPALGGKNRPGR